MKTSFGRDFASALYSVVAALAILAAAVVFGGGQ